MSLNRALMPYDRPHTFGASFLLEAPFGKGKRFANGGGWASKLAGGWRLNGLIAAYSGTPFTVGSNNPLNAPNNSQRANQVKSTVQILGGTGPNQSYFDPFAFSAGTTPAFGTAGLDDVRGPGTFNFDGGLFREFSLRERWKMEFRAEALNLTNTPHFANPGIKRLEHGVEPRWQHQEPGRVHGDHEHARYGAGRHRRADVPPGTSDDVLRSGQ